MGKQQYHVGIAVAGQQCITGHISHRLLYRGHFIEAAAACVCARARLYTVQNNNISATLFHALDFHFLKAFLFRRRGYVYEYVCCVCVRVGWCVLLHENVRRVVSICTQTNWHWADLTIVFVTVWQNRMKREKIGRTRTRKRDGKWEIIKNIFV